VFLFPGTYSPRLATSWTKAKRAIFRRRWSTMGRRTVEPGSSGLESLRAALAQIGVSGEGGLRRTLPVRPLGLRELIRVATLPKPRLADLEPDEPSAFESFEVADPQGIVRGRGRMWFLSSETSIRSCRIEADDPFHPADVVHGESRPMDELLDEASLPSEYDHFGDLGFADSIVYVPVRRTDKQPPNLVVGLSTDLRVVGWAELSSTTGESTCAVNPWNGFLYLPSRDDSGRLEAYDLSSFADRFGRRSQWGRRISLARSRHADIQLRTPAGGRDEEGMQGVAFSANGRIFVTRSGPGPYRNRLYVYNALNGKRFGAEREWDFPGSNDEIEGIAVHPSGILYVGVNDNDGVVFAEFLDTDDFELYTFRFRTLDPSEV
jgi:hypothetical protein